MKIAALIDALPCLATAEGRAMRMENAVPPDCDASGDCVAAEGAAAFVQVPVSVGQFDEGSHRAAHAGQTHEIDAPTGPLPCEWTAAEGTRDVPALTGQASPETTIWTCLSRQTDAAQIRFLSCEVVI